MTDNQLAEQIIKEMQEAGLSTEQMLKVLKLAREKYINLKLKKQNENYN